MILTLIVGFSIANLRVLQVHVLQVHVLQVQSIVYKSSPVQGPVHVLQHAAKYRFYNVFCVQRLHLKMELLFKDF